MIKSRVAVFLSAVSVVALGLVAGRVYSATPADPAARPAPALTVIDEGQLLPYLEQVIAWQRESAAIDATPGSARESLLKDALAQSATKALTAAFQFARSQAEILDKQSAASGQVDQSGDRARLQAAASAVADRLADFARQVSATKDALRSATAKQKPALQAHLADIQGQIKIATAQQDLLNNVLAVFNGMSASANSGLLGKVDSLAESATPSEKIAASAAKPAQTTTTVVDKNGVATAPSAGLLDLTGDLFRLWKETRDLEALSNGAADLLKTNKQFLDVLRAGLRAAIQQGTSLSATSGVAPAAQTPGAPQPTVDSILADFKQLASGVVPVTQTNMWLDASRRTLDEWDKTIRDEVGTIARRLGIRLGVLAVLILIPMGFAEIARRATNRYVRDEKRVKQLRAVRRTLLTITIVIIVLLNLVSEVGSIATFAGVITAGLAVAFQNVLLSLVAHFFFYGKYSVRAGDRVSVSGVIGDVVHVGAVRFYVRELEDHDGKLQSTGRIAAFPNSILFQTSAFFKYV